MLVAVVLAVCSPLVHANDLYICKDSSPSGALSGDIFTFHVTGGHLTSAVTVSVPVGHCVYVAQGANLQYNVSEDPYPGTVLSNVSAVPSNGLLSWQFPQRSALVEVFQQSTYVHFTNSVQTEALGRWTGGGSIFTTSDERVTHGFELHCDPSHTPNRLEINFGGNRFHLSTLVTATCYFNRSGIPVIVGTGRGTYNGTTGYTIHFTFTDAGEPGRHDYASYLISGPNNQTILSASGYLTFGNHDYHKQ